MNRLNRLIKIVRIIPKVGTLNVAYILYYRFSLRTGLRKIAHKPKQYNITDEVCFIGFYDSKLLGNICQNEYIQRADKIIEHKFNYYFWFESAHQEKVKWLLDPFSNKELSSNDQHWTEISDFGQSTGDIKNLWELGRFYWSLDLAMAAALTKQKIYIDKLNELIKDFLKCNNYNLGVHWRCGQEVSLRALNLLVISTFFLQKSSHLNEIILDHLERVYLNINYALAQQNNHGITEAAFLVIGGLVLSEDGCTDANKYLNKGQRILNREIASLVMKDGSFSQHSINYHRVMLDTLCFVEVYNREYETNIFTELSLTRIKAATRWLSCWVDENTGFAPNLGANDGARVMNLTTCPYSDFRPTVQLANSLFLNTRVYEEGPWDDVFHWLGMAKPTSIANRSIEDFDIYDSAYVLRKTQGVSILFRLPMFKFRPKHNDVFHFDLTYEGINYLCDSGSYSYYSKEGVEFKETRAHNTVSIGGREQMPLLSKFMLGDWIGKAEEESFKENNFAFSYRDGHGISHSRKIRVIGRQIEIEDYISSNDTTSYLHWNLPFDSRKLRTIPMGVEVGKLRLVVESASHMEMEDKFISKMYNKIEKSTRLTFRFEGNYVKTIIQLS